MAVARLGPAFSASEREVLRYLIGQAATDELTGLSNSRHFREWMRREALRLSRFGGELALVMLDIDDFKRVNDTYGHLQGNAVLAAVGRTLKLESRGVDEPARYGGDEFVLALPETPREGALEVADRVRERIAETTVPGVDGGPTVAITVSVGVATMPADAGGIEAVIATADAALYEAKRSGKNRLGRPEGL